MENNHYLKDKVMRRVRFVYFFRKIANATTAKAFVLFSFAILGSVLVSVRHILANAPGFSNPTAIYNFYLAAFMNTTVVVQTLLLATLIVGVLFIIDLLKRYQVGKERELQLKF